jgi:hypothetical protein
MKRPSKFRVALLTLALVGACFTPSTGKADYYGWGGYYWPTYTGYYPAYSTGYFPSYWDGYYSGAYTAGYYPVSWSSYYAPSCCGSCGSCGWSGCGSCSYGCGSCGLSCGSCGSGCGSCGSGCGSCGVGCGSCGVGSCGASCCGAGLACGSGCGTVSGSDCSGAAPSRPGTRKTPPDADDKFEPRPSPTYDEPPTRKKKAPTETPPGGPTGGASLDVPQNDTPSGGSKYTRDKGTDDTQSGSKPATNDGYKPPVTKPSAGTGDQPFSAGKPVGPSPAQPEKKKAPMPTVPAADSSDAGRNGSTASSESEPDVFTNNPALALQERPTWSYAGSVVQAQRLSVTRIASIGSPVPRRIKSPVVELPGVRLVENVARN